MIGGAKNQMGKSFLKGVAKGYAIVLSAAFAALQAIYAIGWGGRHLLEKGMGRESALIDLLMLSPYAFPSSPLLFSSEFHYRVLLEGGVYIVGLFMFGALLFWVSLHVAKLGGWKGEF